MTPEAVSRARRAIQINERYDAQELVRVGGSWKNMRKDWTAAQKRRMRKHHNKNGSRAMWF